MVKREDIKGWTILFLICLWMSLAIIHKIETVVLNYEIHDLSNTGRFFDILSSIYTFKTR